ncbi:DnaA ATPase domain-containing protein [Thalassovita sp.]|uniref:DnaA ATPase domain-containing protein n=1 Tax=Thalassovita sp. TaxID=1979401 RepID=UPI0029DE7C13|nr:DnaA/Hda family protein [Thalassovita sp.]
MAAQLSFDLPVRPALGREDFFVSPTNAFAVALIEDWRHWAGRKLALIGPAGSGKTHLAHVWAAATGARILPAADLAQADIPELACTPVAVEDVPAIAGDRRAEEALFHLHNLLLAERQFLLITADRPVLAWGLGLPDLLSRMQGTNAATLDQPDDQLLAAIVAKMFADRQVAPAAGTIPYMVAHMERSFDAARDLVARVDQAALDEKRPVNRGLAAEILSQTPMLPYLDNPDE